MLPSFLQPIFWSWQFDQLDLNKHKKLIIGQILAFGSFQMIQWLLDNFKKEDISGVLEHTGLKDSDRKSYVFWKTIL